ncbi:M28 family peptidase, partial [candidate division KSB1 bacterium]
MISYQPDGNFLQIIPLEYVSVSEQGTKIRIIAYGETEELSFLQDFGGSFSEAGEISGDIILVGAKTPEFNWDDYGDIDPAGKVVVFLQPEQESGGRGGMMAMRRGRGDPAVTGARELGAVTVITVVSPDREQQAVETGELFRNTERLVWPATTARTRTAPPQQTDAAPFIEAEIRHNAAAVLLGITQERLNDMFEFISSGNKLTPSERVGRRLELTVEMATREDHTQNVVAVLEGTDPVLKNEYVLFGSHYDHTGARGDQINNGADDDGSGTVAMLEIAQAFSVERPKRSVVMVWHTGEEKGLRGARYYVENSHIPLESISAQLQMDMISRNEPDSICVIGTHFLSSDLDKIIIDTANKIDLIILSNRFNYDREKYPERGNNYFTQSDHQAYHQVGIPTTFFFSDVHEDLHRPTDTVEKCDMDKMERVTKLVYAVGFNVGNYNRLMILDNNPEVTKRGK